MKRIQKSFLLVVVLFLSGIAPSAFALANGQEKVELSVTVSGTLNVLPGEVTDFDILLSYTGGNNQNTDGHIILDTYYRIGHDGTASSTNTQKVEFSGETFSAVVKGKLFIDPTIGVEDFPKTISLSVVDIVNYGNGLGINVGNFSFEDEIIRIVLEDNQEPEEEQGDSDEGTPGEETEDGSDPGDSVEGTPGEETEDGSDPGDSDEGTPGEETEDGSDQDGKEETPGKKDDGDGKDDHEVETPGKEEDNQKGETPVEDEELTKESDKRVEYPGKIQEVQVSTSNNQSEKRLPNTATNQYNWFISGLLLVMAGISLLFNRRKRY